jgi:predicted nucleic acid-binding protein
MSGEFVDTNILVYAHDTSAGDKRRLASDLVVRVARARSGMLSIQVLVELLVTVTRKIPHPLLMAEAIEIVDDLSTWKVHEPRAGDVTAAARIAVRYGISVWDAMIVHAAAELGASVLWSEDLSHGQLYEGVQVQSPFEAHSL